MASLEKKVDAKSSDLEANLLKAISASKSPAAPPDSMPGSAGDSVGAILSSSVKEATSRYDARPGGWVAPTRLG